MDSLLTTSPHMAGLYHFCHWVFFARSLCQPLARRHCECSRRISRRICQQGTFQFRVWCPQTCNQVLSSLWVGARFSCLLFTGLWKKEYVSLWRLGWLDWVELERVYKFCNAVPLCGSPRLPCSVFESWRPPVIGLAPWLFLALLSSWPKLATSKVV